MKRISPGKIGNTALSISLLIAMVAFAPVSSFLVRPAYAAGISASKVTISDSRAGAAATTHTFNFTTATTGTIETITFQYCTAASGTCTAPTGLTLGTAVGSVSGIGAGTAGVSTNTVTYTVSSPTSVPASTAISIPFTNVTNPTTVNTTFFVRITTNATGPVAIDSGTVAFAILDTNSLEVSASVDPTFTFTVAAANTGSVNGATINVTTSTASTIPFGTLSAGSSKIAAHDLTVSTNAGGGYTVTVNGTTSPVLVSGSNNIDEFSGTNASPTAWSAPAGSSQNVNTGYFGYTTNDSTLGTGTAARFTDGGNEWAGFTTSPAEVAYNATGVTNQTTRVGWQAEVNALQPAGTYNGTVILVATPTY